MAKLLVVNSQDDSRVPFLRGILTRSLQDSGLSFNSAYAVASLVRKELAGRDEVASAELRNLVAAHLKEEHAPGLLRRYQAPQPTDLTIRVRNPNGRITAFSRSQHQQRLETCGLTSEQAIGITIETYHHLLRLGIAEIAAPRLGRLTYSVLKRNLGSDIARRYLVCADYFRSGRPLIVLIGGTVACGKSTIATEIAHRLEIVRTQSTDMLREVMRVMIPKGLLPVLHKSSFNAWKTLARRKDASADKKELMSTGYQAQAELLGVSCEAVVNRALRERVSMILEGVHITPGFVKGIASDDAVVVPIQLMVPDQERLRRRIKGRGTQAEGRRAKRYLEEFESIWQVQSLLVAEAERHGIPIIENTNREETVRNVLSVIIDGMSRHSAASPAEVFATSEPAA